MLPRRRALPAPLPLHLPAAAAHRCEPPAGTCCHGTPAPAAPRGPAAAPTRGPPRGTNAARTVPGVPPGASTRRHPPATFSPHRAGAHACPAGRGRGPAGREGKGRGGRPAERPRPPRVPAPRLFPSRRCTRRGGAVTRRGYKAPAGARRGQAHRGGCGCSGGAAAAPAPAPAPEEKPRRSPRPPPAPRLRGPRPCPAPPPAPRCWRSPSAPSWKTVSPGPEGARCPGGTRPRPLGWGSGAAWGAGGGPASARRLAAGWGALQDGLAVPLLRGVSPAAAGLTETLTSPQPNRQGCTSRKAACLLKSP